MGKYSGSKLGKLLLESFLDEYSGGNVEDVEQIILEVVNKNTINLIETSDHTDMWNFRNNKKKEERWEIKVDVLIKLIKEHGKKETVKL